MKRAEIKALGLGLFRVTWTWEAEWVVLAPSGAIEEVRKVAERQGFRDVDLYDKPEVSVHDEITFIDKLMEGRERKESFNEPDASLVDEDFGDVADLLADRIKDLLHRIYDGKMVCDSCGHVAEVDDFIHDTEEPVCPMCHAEFDWAAKPVVDDKTLSLFKEEI